MGACRQVSQGYIRWRSSGSTGLRGRVHWGGGLGGMDHVTYLARSSTPGFETILKVSLILTGILDAVPVVALKTKGSSQTSWFAWCHANVTGYTSSGCQRNTTDITFFILVVKPDVSRRTTGYVQYSTWTVLNAVQGNKNGSECCNRVTRTVGMMYSGGAHHINRGGLWNIWVSTSSVLVWPGCLAPSAI